MYTEAIRAMVAKALELGIEGAGGIVALPVSQIQEGTFAPELFVLGSFTRGPKENDNGANYMAVALSKLAEMLDTLQDSGTARRGRPLKGEFDYRGGVVKYFMDDDDSVAIAFFSGGTADQDVEVSLEGLREFGDYSPWASS